MSRNFNLALVFIGLLGSATCDADISAAKPEAILEIAKRFGDASLTTNDMGDPKIKGSVSDIAPYSLDPIPYSVEFYACENGRKCKHLLFIAVWKDKYMPSCARSVINRKTTFGRIYHNEEGGLVLDMAVNTAGGVSKANLEETFSLWETLVQSFSYEALALDYRSLCAEEVGTWRD